MGFTYKLLYSVKSLINVSNIFLLATSPIRNAYFFMHTLQKNEFFFVLNRTIIFNI